MYRRNRSAWRPDPTAAPRPLSRVDYMLCRPVGNTYKQRLRYFLPLPDKGIIAPAVWGSISLKPIVLIPARLASTRLPGKPLADIWGEPMIVHVWRRAIAAGIGPVVVATDAEEIAAAVTAAGGRATMTGGHHQSGSDRIWEALQRVDAAAEFDVIVNLQGDLPTIAPDVVRAVLQPFDESSVDIATLAATIRRAAETVDPNIVKMVGTPIAPRRYRALYFTRATAPFGDGPLYHHIGLYAFRRPALERFIALSPSTLEKRERLEQLRALEAGMRIDVVEVNTVPLGVDNPHELERARDMLRKQ
jgi:3-deoxy-manno-octulosonate cytidylyltransferase (CMP-KDO synthetase)